MRYPRCVTVTGCVCRLLYRLRLTFAHVLLRLRLQLFTLLRFDYPGYFIRLPLHCRLVWLIAPAVDWSLLLITDYVHRTVCAGFADRLHTRLVLRCILRVYVCYTGFSARFTRCLPGRFPFRLDVSLLPLQLHCTRVTLIPAVALLRSLFYFTVTRFTLRTLDYCGYPLITFDFTFVWLFTVTTLFVCV